MLQLEENSLSEISPEIREKIKLAFNIFDVNGTGKINPKEIKAALEYLGEDAKNPTVYQLISLLEESDETNEGITLDEFIKAIYQKLGDSKSKSGIRRLFEIFKDDPNSKSIDLRALKNISVQLGENLPEEDIEEMMQRISKGGDHLTFEQFYNIIHNQ